MSIALVEEHRDARIWREAGLRHGTPLSVPMQLLKQFISADGLIQDQDR